MRREAESVLDTVGVAAGIVRALQDHYARCVAPRLDAPDAALECEVGMAALVSVAEELALSGLQAALDASFAQVHPTSCRTAPAGMDLLCILFLMLSCPSATAFSVSTHFMHAMPTLYPGSPGHLSMATA